MAQSSSSSSPIKLESSSSRLNIKRTDFSIETLLKKKSISSHSNSTTDDEDNFTMESTSNNNNNNTNNNNHHQLGLIDSRKSCENSNNTKRDGRLVSDVDKDMATFSWLACTRFKPPKLSRSKKKTGCMRHGRGPRIPFAPHQIAVLESTFSKSQYLSSDCIHRLADTLHLSETRVKIWFQNRRARYRRERETPSISSSHILRNGDHHHHHTKLLSPGIGKMSLDSSSSLSPMNYSNSTNNLMPESMTGTNNNNNNNNNNANNDDLNQRKCFSKRKLLIPDFISMQIQHHRQAQQLQYYLQQQGYSSTNSPLLQSALQSNAAAAAAAVTAVAAHGFPFQFSNVGLIPDFSTGFMNNPAEVTGQFGRHFCTNSSNSPFVPVSVPMQMPFP